MSRQHSHAEGILPPNVLDIIRHYDEQLAKADKKADAEYPTRISWNELAQAAVRLAKDDKTANGWIAGGSIRRIIEDMEDRLPAHIDKQILTSFVEDVVTILQAKAVARQTP
ncbi:MAG: hypothetical protein ACK502_02845 [Alphaproteobacteria bacterium]